MSIPIIQKTKDYYIFRYINFNRPINKRHVQQLKQMILKENLLHLHPVIVNDRMEMVDGQHRLCAAKELGVDIYYIQDSVSYEHILNSNLYQKKLTLQDVVKFYAVKDKIPSYEKLYEYIEDLGISSKAALGLLFGSISVSIIDFIKSGKFQMPNEKKKIEILVSHFKKFVEFVHEKRIKPFSMFSSSTFTIAYRNLILLSEFMEGIWWNKLEQRWFDLKPQINSNEWTRQLISIYNWKNQNPIHINGT